MVTVGSGPQVSPSEWSPTLFCFTFTGDLTLSGYNKRARRIELELWNLEKLQGLLLWNDSY